MDFSYEMDQPVLKNINLDIDANTRVALVGPTGVGKTTMINLLYRFYDPQEGMITVDGMDIKKLKIESLKIHSSIYKKYCRENNIDFRDFSSSIIWNRSLSRGFNDVQLYRIFLYSKENKTLNEFL